MKGMKGCKNWLTGFGQYKNELECKAEPMAGRPPEEWRHAASNFRAAASMQVSIEDKDKRCCRVQEVEDSQGKDGT